MQPVLEHRVVSQEDMADWPLDRSHTGQVLWAESTWGGDSPKAPKLFNWNTWPCRVVFVVETDGAVARGEAVWRQSCYSIRQRGLKLLSAATGEEIRDARVVHLDQERVTVEFRPTDGPGTYHLYYGAFDEVLFEPGVDWLGQADSGQAVTARPECIEARCALDSFYPMEIVGLDEEVRALLERFPDRRYLVFPEDRHRPIVLDREIPAHWARTGPCDGLDLVADRNEYRVFQLGVWSCTGELHDLRVESTDLQSRDGAVVPAGRILCLTLESRIQSEYISRPAPDQTVHQGQVKALWVGIDIPQDAVAGTYTGTVTVCASNEPPTAVQLRVEVRDVAVPEKGDHDAWRLSRLRWLESDVGLSTEVFPPYSDLSLDRSANRIETWGHELALADSGLPASLRYGDAEIMAVPVELSATEGALVAGSLDFVENRPDRMAWRALSNLAGAGLRVEGTIEYDGCAVFDLFLESTRTVALSDLTLKIAWRGEHAVLGSGMGYRGRRNGNRCWRDVQRSATCFSPAIWMGSVQAGMGWATWDTKPWQDAARVDAATVTEEGDQVVLQLNLGDHAITTQAPWHMRFALRPSPVKPPDVRHWQFRYLHRGGGFSPGPDDTPHSYLEDDCRRLDELRQLGVTRLNLHDWWGPAFNYAWQWDRPDNLSRLTEEAHKRGIFVKVYNSGRELSNLAPEFRALVNEGARHDFDLEVNPEPDRRYQDAWHQNHAADGLPQGWPRLHPDLGNEHTVPVSNATRNGNFYLESMRYMTRFFGTDGAYWDGADGPTLGHREMAKRLWVMFRQTNPDGLVDVHHGNSLVRSPIADFMLCFPFIDSIWHGEGFPYDRFDPWEWLTEISGLPFNLPSEILGGEDYIVRAMLFGIWPRAGWGAGTECQRRLWACFDRFHIEQARMLGWWEEGNGVTVDRAGTYVTAFVHPEGGALLAVATWEQPVVAWMGQQLDVSLRLDRAVLGLPGGLLQAVDVLTDEEVDICLPLALPDEERGRIVWVRPA